MFFNTVLEIYHKLGFFFFKTRPYKIYEFRSLTQHTHFSLCTIIKTEELALKAAELQMPACAITDHNNLFGTIRFYNSFKNQGIKPVIGQGFF